VFLAYGLCRVCPRGVPRGMLVLSGVFQDVGVFLSDIRGLKEYFPQVRVFPGVFLLRWARSISRKCGCVSVVFEHRRRKYVKER
jgi:hypothetical protein